MQQLVLILHVLVAFSLIVLVLIQQGKGADIGASFGSGASQTVFGSQGSGSFLLKLTGIMGLLFFATSILLTYLTSQQVKQQEFILPTAVQQTAAPLSKPAQPSQGSLPASLLPQGSAPASTGSSQ